MIGSVSDSYAVHKLGQQEKEKIPSSESNPAETGDGEIITHASVLLHVNNGSRDFTFFLKKRNMDSVKALLAKIHLRKKKKLVRDATK